MQFLLMCCFDETRWNALAGDERAKIMDAYQAWVTDLVESGHYKSGGKLDQSGTASTLRQPDGKPRAVDGPFSEAREQIGGFHVLECRDRDEALALAQKIPTLPAGGTIEVRPMLRELGRK